MKKKSLCLSAVILALTGLGAFLFVKLRRNRR